MDFILVALLVSALIASTWEFVSLVVIALKKMRHGNPIPKGTIQGTLFWVSGAVTCFICLIYMWHAGVAA